MEHYSRHYSISFQIHTEAVTGVVGRAELLASIGYLLALQAYQKAAHNAYPRKTKWTYLMITMAAITMALLCKEQGITVVAVCAVFEVAIRHKMRLGQLYNSMGKGYRGGGGWVWPALQRLSLLGGLFVVLLLVRLRLMGATLPVFTKFDNPAASASEVTTKILTYTYLASLNVWLLLAPCKLAFFIFFDLDGKSFSEKL